MYKDVNRGMCNNCFSRGIFCFLFFSLCPLPEPFGTEAGMLGLAEVREGVVLFFIAVVLCVFCKAGVSDVNGQQSGNFCRGVYNKVGVESFEFGARSESPGDTAGCDSGIGSGLHVYA